MFRTIRTFLFAMVILSLLTASCAAPTPEVVTKEVEVEKEVVVTATPPPPPEHRVLRLVYGSEPETMDAHLMKNQETQSIQWAFREMLTLLWTDGTVDPLLVTDWEPNEDSTVWTLKVREGVKCHNGETFDAEDVVYSILRARDHPQSGRHGYVRNIADAVALDSHTVEVTCDPSDIDVHIDLAWVFGVCKDYVESLGPADAVSDHPVGTGPFKFVEYKPGEYVKGERFDDYWGEPSDFEEVVERIIPSSSVRVAALLAGEVDHIPAISAEEATIVEAMENAYVQQSSTVTTVFIDIDSKSPMMPDGVTPNPLTDVRVRKALYQAIDIDLIVEEILGGYADVQTQVWLPAVRGWDPEAERLPYDPERARELLAEAGYPDGFEIELVGFRALTPNNVEVAEAVAAMWEAIGVETSVAALPSNVFGEYVRDGNARLTSNNSGMGTLDLYDWTSGWLFCDARMNWMGRCWPEIDALSKEAGQVTNLEKREEMLIEVGRRYVEKVWAIPMYSFSRISGILDHVEWEPALSGEPRAGEFKLAP